MTQTVLKESILAPFKNLNMTVLRGSLSAKSGSDLGVNCAKAKSEHNVRGPKVVIALRSSVFFWPRSFPSKSSKLLRGGIIRKEIICPMD